MYICICVCSFSCVLASFAEVHRNITRISPEPHQNLTGVSPEVHRSSTRGYRIGAPRKGG